jgi:hypothetical protein
VSRVVVRVAAAPSQEDEIAEDIFFSLEDAPYDIDNFDTLQRFDVDRDTLLEHFHEDPPSGDNMREVGSLLLEQLGSHPAVADAVRNALMTPTDECCPLYVRLVGSEQAGEYPWETLFDARSGFLALEGRWPIARIAAQVPRQQDLRTFLGPLRIMLVMSALGVSATDEWMALHDALTALRGEEPLTWGEQGLGLELDIWVGQADLAKQIASDLDEMGVPGTVSLLTDSARLLADVKRFDPHILHLFCHGTGGPTPLLQLATRRDHVLGVSSSILIEPLQFRDRTGSTWLVTLNCCEGGSDANGARSIAYLLVNVGYPAIVGMREPVSAKNASLFARSFYASLLSYAGRNLVPGTEFDLEIAIALVAPRRDLRDQFDEQTPTDKAAKHRDWTLPVLYVRPDPLRVKCLVASPEHPAGTRKNTTDYLDTLMKYRMSAPPGTPEDVLTNLDAEIARALRALAGVGE